MVLVRSFLGGGSCTHVQEAEDDLLYGDLGGGGGGDGGEDGSNKEYQGTGLEEDLELNLYEVGDKEEDDEGIRRGERNRGPERERYPAPAGPNKVRTLDVVLMEGRPDRNPGGGEERAEEAVLNALECEGHLASLTLKVKAKELVCGLSQCPVAVMTSLSTPAQLEWAVAAVMSSCVDLLLDCEPINTLCLGGGADTRAGSLRFLIKALAYLVCALLSGTVFLPASHKTASGGVIPQCPSVTFSSNQL